MIIRQRCAAVLYTYLLRFWGRNLFIRGASAKIQKVADEFQWKFLSWQIPEQGRHDEVQLLIRRIVFRI